MIIGECANRVLSFLDLDDEEEYTTTHALEHVNQAIFELADEMEIKGLNDFSLYDLETPATADEPAYWANLPGRFPVTDVTGVALSSLSHIRRLWLAVDGETITNFSGVDIREILDRHGDDTGQPENYAIDGEYIIIRPIPETGVTYNLRAYFATVPGTYASGDEPLIAAQAPYAVIYRACEIATAWTMDDKAVLKYEKLSQRAIERYALRATLVDDHPRFMEEYNG